MALSTEKRVAEDALLIEERRAHQINWGAINDLNSEDMAAISAALISGDVNAARSALADRTELTEAQIASIVNGAEQEIENLSNTEAVQQAQDWVEQKIQSLQSSIANNVSDLGDRQVTPDEVRQLMNQVDSDVLMDASTYLIQGQPDRAKDVLVARTSLDDGDIDAIVNGAEQEVQQMVDEVQAELNEVTEAAGDYTQAILWAAFVASALGLIAAMFGGSRIIFYRAIVTWRAICVKYQQTDLA